MRLLPVTLLTSVLLLAAGCAPAHRLAEVDLQTRSVAVTAVIPPEPGVVSGPWPLVDRRMAPPTARRQFEASRAADDRLQQAARQVDVAEIVARRALVGASRELAFRPADDPQAADYVLDVRLLDFALRARSFRSGVVLVTDADVRLIEAASGEVMWHRRVRNRDAVDTRHLGFTDERRRVTPEFLTRLSTEEMALGLEHLALLAADQIAGSLAGAYASARR